MGRRINELGRETTIRMCKPGRATTNRKMNREGNDNGGCIAASKDKNGQVGSGEKTTEDGMSGVGQQ